MKIVTIGGGTGQFTLLSALKELNVDLTAIVSMVDSGGSTGRLRDELGTLPPGDVLKCLLALSPYKDARNILQARFRYSERLRDHNAGNMLLVFLSEYLHGNFPEAVEAMSEILNVKGTVLPSTTSKATLVAILENNDRIFGESEIDVVRGRRESRIKETYLVPHNAKMQVYPRSVEAIMNADYIIIGPGDLYTSITPNLLLPELKKAVTDSPAQVVYLSNIMTKNGETNNFNVSDFLRVLESYLGAKVNMVVANNRRPSGEILQKYAAENSQFVEFDLQSDNERTYHTTDLITEHELVRHDIGKLTNLFRNILGL
ncbi:YvcK family protein [Candidatus Falkowbacteria bacterium CG10_big_fil_rev_8_21_14_0_10_39_11]|uniref:Putative gluconeogenesis factor n=1 Tax=Candidatus Falkowbacteria bacterium CG10_big_fil_rev_8_21_14_0_10_39_11 TaxID=1974565 RepID=A0A2H0V432_9BACT|nr:MAG: YvcK family protein [Candidatus Falkowbacteria bacterium CG10_big_fil_rev_8_21_14_0_10_39_11]